MLVKDKAKESKTSMKRTINFSSIPENLTLVEKLVDDICIDHNINADYYGNIMISITEAVNNAIQHGNKYDPSKSVEVGFNTDNDAEVLSFTIEDEGDGFDFNSLPDPTEPKNVEKLNGRGIFLMKNLADEVDFSKEGRVVELNFKMA